MEKKAGFLFKDDNITLYNDGKEKYQSFELDIEVVIDGAEARLWGYGHDSFEAYSVGLKRCDDLLKSLEDIKARITRLRDTAEEGKDPEFVSSKAFEPYERHYLHESYKEHLDCNGCIKLKISPYEERKRRIGGWRVSADPQHLCRKYGVNLFYYQGSDKIEPCAQCLKENFNKEN